jgi:hypothetical protein
MNGADDRTPGRLGWLVDLFRQVFSDRAIIPAGTYCAYNAFVGLLLLAAAVLMRVEPSFGSPRAGIAAALAAVALIAAVPVALRRPTAAPKLLFVHGLIFVLLAIALAVDAIGWTRLPPPRGAFRYAPGLTLVLFTYGGLQIGTFGPWRNRARAIRIGGLAVGVIIELITGVVLLRSAFAS